MPKLSRKAAEHVEAAQLLLQHGYYRDAVSRAYYAIYTAVEDYVGLAPTGAWSHRGIRSAFAAKLIDSGVDRSRARELGQKLVAAFDARGIADYHRDPITKEFANQILANAKSVLDWIEKEVKP